MLVAFDTETWLIGQTLKDPFSKKKNNVLCNHMVAPKLVCGSFYHNEHGTVSDRLETLCRITGWLEDDTVDIIGHNIAYDLGVVCAEEPDLIPAVFSAYENNRIYDTKIRQALLDIKDGNRRWGQGLADLSYRLLNEKLEKEDTWRLRYSELEGVPIALWPDAAVEYSKKDAEVTYRCFEAQEKDRQFLTNQFDQCRAAWALHLMSLWGVRTDPERVDALSRTLDDEHHTMMKALKDSGIHRIDGTKNMSVIKQKVTEGYSGNPPLTETGQAKTDEQTLLESGDSDLITLGNALTSEKIRSSWIPVLKAGTKAPICCSYNTLVDSGRTSSTNPNLQNPPRANGVRECFIPRPGYVYCAVDFDTAELRSLAQIMYTIYGYSAMRDALIEGKDLHLNMAANIKGCTYETVADAYKAGDSEAKMLRQMSKAANFGLPGGLGVEKFMLFAKQTYGVELDRTAAKQLKEQFFQSYPEVKTYLTEFIEMELQDEREEKPAGAIIQLFSNRVRGDLHYTAAANSFFQGLTADGAKQALWDIANACYVEGLCDALYGCRPVLFLHDEIIMEVPEERGHEAALQMVKIMSQSMSQWCPDVPITCAPVLMRRWLKGASATYVQGRLVPTEEKTK